MVDLGPDDQLSAAVYDLLADGPVPVADVVARLDAKGLLDELRDEGYDEDELPEALLDAVMVTDAIWLAGDDRLVRADDLLEGIVLTHRLSAEELAAGEVRISPDLVVLDWNARRRLSLRGRGPLEDFPGIDTPGEDNSVFVGPQAWLEPFKTGDVLAFVRHGDEVTVQRVDDVGAGESEIELLRAVVPGRIRQGHGEEAAPLVLDALTADRTAFRKPVRPLGELLEAAGLERRGFMFGLAGQEWRTRAEDYEDRQRQRAARTWDFDRCCTAAFDSVCDAFAAFRAGETDFGVRAETIARDLAHGSVGPAFAEYVLDRTSRGNPDVAAFAAFLAEAAPKDMGPVRLLMACEAEQRGDLVEAEQSLRAARREDAAYGPAAAELAMYELDRGELERAIALLQHPDLDPDSGVLARLTMERERTGARFRGVGRNDPCPCGSGRKFKTCCQRRGALPLPARTGLLMDKLVVFVSRHRRQNRLIGVASSVCDPDDPDLASRVAELAASPLILDFVIFEGGGAEDYLDERGALLPADERRLLEDLLAEPRRLWEVVAVQPGRSLALRDTKTGDLVQVNERLGSQGRQVGELMLGRVARLPDENQLVGVPLEIPLRLRESTLALVDADPGADTLAAWYGAAIAFPRLTNRENEPLQLCRAELSTHADIADLRPRLDAVLERDDGDTWVEFWTHPSGERIIRGHVRFSGGRLHVDANSEARVERLLATVTSVVPDAIVEVDERTDPRDAARRVSSSEVRAESASTAELEAALDEYLRQKEEEWLSEEIPALGGLTPMQALDDPTRREDLIALLREFEDRPAPAMGRGFDPARLRRLLGL